MNFNNQEVVGIGIFCGAGGLDHGLMQAGIKFGVAIDFDAKACESYQINHPDTVVWNKDISTITGEDIRKVVGDKPILLCGGPPCQSWSEFQVEIEGSKKGLEDKRGHMIYQYLRIAEELQPIAVIFENVPYMVTNPKHLTEFEKFKTNLQSRTGLQLEHQVLNAIHYGQAQLRERVIMIGTQQGIPNPFQFLQEIKGPQTLREALVDCPSSEFFQFRKTDREVMKSIKAGECWNALSPQMAYQQMKEEYKGICLDCGTNFQGTNQCTKCQSTRIKNGRGITSFLRRLSWERPSPTICAVPTNKTHGMLAHPTEERCLSIQECARIQGFPDNYTFVGTIFEQQRQIGNAVPCGIGEAIGLALMSALQQVKPTKPTNESTEIISKSLHYIVNHQERFSLTELEKDFVRIVYKNYKVKQSFPKKYEIYIKEIVLKLSRKSKNIAI
ncbi:DNA cytosine methyltransferase [Viridibacillus arvi]|uniref:DNA cytosine methyltransferase n=1 Tax=Viridibacillus arvi TaxID=263475 RepID=UPI0034CF39DC